MICNNYILLKKKVDVSRMINSKVTTLSDNHRELSSFSPVLTD